MRLILPRLVFRLLVAATLLQVPSFAQASKCGTAAFIQLEKHGQQTQRELPLMRASQSGRFMIHYALEGQDRVSQSFLDSTEAILDHCWSFEVDSLGYPAPVPMEDGFVHVYLMDLPNLYGYTDPVASSGTGLVADLVLDNDVANAAHATRGINGLRVTVAHEFFHLVQFAMRLNPFHLYFYEWSSTWMEEQVYPEINDYLYYLPDFFETPSLSIRTFNGVREYATAILPLTVSDLAGDAVLHEIWVRFAASNDDPFEVLMEVAGEVGYPAETLAQEFASRLLATGRNAIPEFGFEDARWFPELELTDGNCGDLQWCGEVGEWGILPGLLPGGVQGNLSIQLSPGSETTFISLIRTGASFTVLRPGNLTEVTGTQGMVAGVNLSGDEQTITLKAVPDRAGLPVAIEMSPAWPNPSNGIVNWSVKLDRPGTIEASIYNLLGQQVAHWQVSTGQARTARLSWDGVSFSGRASSSGLYILRAVAGDASASQRLLLVR